jgi:RNA polymerase sigma factor (sigma-70 family)
LIDALRILEEGERQVLMMRFGLDGGEPRTLSDVGKIFNLTRERVRQIEGRAISKLRHPSCSIDLESLL